MSDIIPDKEKLIKSLNELEFEFKKGNISKNSYNSQKKKLNDKIDTIEIVNRVKKLQGKDEAGKTFDYLTQQKKDDKVQEEQEELMRKYMTSSKTHDLRTIKEKKRGINRNRTILATLLAVIFISGVVFGFVVINGSFESSAVPMTLNQSALTTSNNTTNITNNNTPLNTSQTSQLTTTNSNTGSTPTSTNTGTPTSTKTGSTPTSNSSSSNG
jgi:cytoskeletal protein RodZ